MKKTFIIIGYFLVFWIMLPGAMNLASMWIDNQYFPGEALPFWTQVLGWIIIVPASIALLYSVYDFKKLSGELPVSALPPDQLIEKGLFAIWRHPIYLFSVVFILALALVLRSPGYLFVVYPVFIVATYTYTRIEEHSLVKRFGKKYQLYRKRVPLVIPRFIEILRVIARPYFRRKFGIQIINAENIPASPPYFVVSSHRNYLDPFLISYALPHMVRHICTYEMFRKPTTALLLRWIGAIPKKRFKPDMKSTKQIMDALNKGFAVGVFPEGERSWTGAIQSFKPGSLKMFVHNNNIPILPVIVEGNYHMWPRWSKRPMKAEVRITIGAPIQVERGMDIKLFESILMQKTCPRPESEMQMLCKTKDMIEKLSIVIYRCPYCSALESMTESNPDKLICNECGKTIVLKPDLSLYSGADHSTKSESIDGMYRKIRVTATDIEKMTGSDGSSGFTLPEALVYRAAGEYSLEEGLKLRPMVSGDILLTNQGIYIEAGKRDQILSLCDIDAVTVEGNNRLQIYRSKTDNIVQLRMTSSSALLWQDLIVTMLDRQFNKQISTR